MGKKYGESLMVDSESSALSALGYEFEYDIDPGAAVIISESGVVEKAFVLNLYRTLLVFLSLYTFRAPTLL